MKVYPTIMDQQGPELNRRLEARTYIIDKDQVGKLKEALRDAAETLVVWGNHIYPVGVGDEFPSGLRHLRNVGEVRSYKKEIDMPPSPSDAAAVATMLPDALYPQAIVERNMEIMALEPFRKTLEALIGRVKYN